MSRTNPRWEASSGKQGRAIEITKNKHPQQLPLSKRVNWANKQDTPAGSHPHAAGCKKVHQEAAARIKLVLKAPAAAILEWLVRPLCRPSPSPACPWPSPPLRRRPAPPAARCAQSSGGIAATDPSSAAAGTTGRTSGSGRHPHNLSSACVTAHVSRIQPSQTLHYRLVPSADRQCKPIAKRIQSNNGER